MVTFPSSADCVRIENAERSIELCHIIDYRTMKKTTYPFHRVPQEDGAMLDRQGRTTEPLKIMFNAKVTNTEKQTLDSIETDRLGVDITMGDMETSYEGCLLEDLDFTYNIGSTSLPWIVRMMFLASRD